MTASFAGRLLGTDGKDVSLLPSGRPKGKSVASSTLRSPRSLQTEQVASGQSRAQYSAALAQADRKAYSGIPLTTDAA